MPASPPAPSEISNIAAQPQGWYVQYPDGSAHEVVCWATLFDNTGGVPMVFDQLSGKLVSASALGLGYVLVHSSSDDRSTLLLDAATEPGIGPVVSLGGLHSRKSTYVTSDDPGVAFSITLQGSIDGIEWFPFGSTLTKTGVQSEVILSIHYARARLDSIQNGSITLLLAWS